ncbi:MAG: ADP-ribose pyrophosphatase [Phycisphaeraceae bacterium]|nr:MAG: ADP-ribose pyrophosphatase [Phycisphaeraceae bacterium]
MPTSKANSTYANPHEGKPLVTKVIGAEELWSGRAFDFVRLRVRSPGGTERDRLIVRHPGAVVILPILETPTGPEIVYVRNERHALGAWLDELPAGGLDAGEDPEFAARRELREETGFAAATLIPLGRFHTTPGVTDELMYAYAATDLEEVGQDLDEHEILTVHRAPVRAFFDRADSGSLTDAKTILALHLARARGLLE